MPYILTPYVNEAGWPKLTKAEQEQGMAANMAYTEALKNAGVLRERNSLSTPAMQMGQPVTLALI